MNNDASAPPYEKPQFRVVSEDYNQINAIAHRKWPPKFNAPALTWYRAFWVRDIYENMQGVPPSLWVKQSLDEAILSFYSGLRACNTNVEFHPNIPKFRNGRHESNIFLFSKVVSEENFDIVRDTEQELTPRERDVFHGEGRVVTLKFQFNNIDMSVRVELRGEYFSIFTLAEFRDDDNKHENHFEKITFGRLSSMYGTFQEFLTTGIGVCASDVGKYLYLGFWEDFWENVALKAQKPQIFNTRLFRNMFADFRGIIVSNETCRAVCCTDMEKGTWGYCVENKLRCMLHNFEIHEVTASYALGNRLLYMSTLGTQPPTADSEEVVPLQYIVYAQQGRSSETARGTNKWQLGRFIDRLNLLCTVRLAALKYYPMLLNVASALSGFEPHLNAARRAVADLNPNAEDAIARAHQAFDKITHEFNQTTRTLSGVLYRIERARYYITQFYKNVAILRLETVDGYQRYDHFVEWRLGPSFDFIDRLGKKYEGAMSSLTSLDQYHLSIRANTISSRASNTNDRVLEIQKWGEFILFLFPVPYYASGLVEHTLAGVTADVITILIWLISVSYAFYKLDKAESEKPEKTENEMWQWFVRTVPLKYFWLAVPLSMIAFLFFFYIRVELKLQETMSKENPTSIEHKFEESMNEFLKVVRQQHETQSASPQTSGSAPLIFNNTLLFDSRGVPLFTLQVEKAPQNVGMKRSRILEKGYSPPVKKQKF